jgi:hypothetical protein
VDNGGVSLPEHLEILLCYEYQKRTLCRFNGSWTDFLAAIDRDSTSTDLILFVSVGDAGGYH